jgi:hypothetical protein
METRMKKLFHHTAIAAAICLAALMSVSSTATATSYQGWWNNWDESGMGINVGQQGQQIFVSWYMYDELGNPSFLLFFGELDGNNTLSAPLRRYFGPEPPHYDENLWYGEIVGTATIEFRHPYFAVFKYDYDGKKGITVWRPYTFNAIDLSGLYAGASIYTASNCGSNNGSYSIPDLYDVDHHGDEIQFDTVYEECSYDGSIEQWGNHFRATGGVYCSNGTSGSWVADDVVAGENTIEIHYKTEFDNGCVIEGRAGGIK